MYLVPYIFGLPADTVVWRWPWFSWDWSNIYSDRKILDEYSLLRLDPIQRETLGMVPYAGGSWI